MKENTSKSDAFTGIVKQGRPFVKMHGLRNDFVIVDARQEAYRPSVPEIVGICDRHAGVGADELLIVEPPRLKTKAHYAFVRILNPDGREVEACGNDFSPGQLAWLSTTGAEPHWISYPDHVNYFDFDSLKRLLARAGLFEVSRETA